MKNFEPDHNEMRSERLVDQALRREPGFILNPGFADRVLMQLDARHAKSGSHEWLWLGLGLVGFVTAAIVGVVLSGFRPSLGVLTFVSSHGGLFVFGIVFILALQWIDRRFVRKTTTAS